MESCPIGHPRLILLKLFTPAFVIDFFLIIIIPIIS